MTSVLHARTLRALTLMVAAGMTAFAVAPACGEPVNVPGSSDATPEAIAPLSQRYANPDVEEVPDFQKHVVPLLGRLGCNGRACHGSFQGRGGFQLSLFGYDFRADHEALLDESSGRVDVDDVDESLILAKPVDADMHEGGKRFDSGSWQHHVLRRWIEGGAPYDKTRHLTLRRLQVTPSEVRFETAQQSVDLKVVAQWQDGTVEDVTELCRFSSNDDAVAEIDAEGHLRSGERGDTHVVVYYDNAVVPIPVMRRFSDAAPSPGVAPDHVVDRLVQQKLDKIGVVPSGQCSDAEFVRRVSMDVTGILPSGQRVRAFLEDDAPDKRQRLVDELLDSPGYAAWWATRFSDWTGNSEEQLNNVLPVRNVASRLWYEWLRARLDSNQPYDEIIEGIVTAESRQADESYLEYCQAMTEACTPGNAQRYAERDGMPLFWARRNFQKPEERAIGFAYAFLGIRIECAQCHKHPFDQWSKDDFEQFSQLFTPIRTNQNLVAPDAKQNRDELVEKITGGKQLKGGDLRRAVYKAAQNGQTVPFGELLVNARTIGDRARKARALAKKKGKPLPPASVASGKILGQEDPVTLDQDPRQPLMRWLRDPENPFFAKAIVNRVWSNYFGIGIVDPTDDMNLANPPSNAALLNTLADEFIAHDFDLKWLHRTIVTSETYQRSTQTNATNANDRTNFSHHIPRRLPAEVVFDAVVLATGSDKQAASLRDRLDQMAIADGKPRLRNQQNFALEVFGQSIRESNCDCDRSDAPSLLQSIYLRNDADMHDRLADEQGWVAQACQTLGIEGPGSEADPRQRANERRADAMRQQILDRITQFHELPATRKKKMRPQLVREYQRMSQRFGQLGYELPSLKSLITDRDAWSELTPLQETQAEPKQATIDSLVEEAYLRTLSRFPEPEEAEISVGFIQESESAAAGLQSLLWALVNTKEFIITH